MSHLQVLIAGGGVAGVEAALALRHFADDRVQITVTTPGPDLVQRPESVTTPFTGVGAPRLPLERLAALGVDLRQDTVSAIHPDRHEVHTTDGAILRYDRLVLATGAHAVDSVPGALHFRGPLSAGRLEGQIAAAKRSDGPLTLVVPSSATWPLAVYELALQAGARLPGRVRLVTPEARPLETFGAHVSDAVARLLDAGDVEVVTETHSEAVLEDQLIVGGGAFLATGPVVTVPRLVGPRFSGLGYDADGFLAVDAYGRVHGQHDVFAAGDVTNGAIKQGGLATQQADAAAAAIAADAGASVEPAPATRVLRAQLVTAERPLWLRGWLGSGHPGQVSSKPLWQPAGKLAGRFLAGFIATGEPDHELEDLHVPAGVA